MLTSLLLVSGTILVYGVWNMVCGIWYENGIHSVFAYVSCALRSGCLQHSASIPCIISQYHVIANKGLWHPMPT